MMYQESAKVGDKLGAFVFCLSIPLSLAIAHFSLRCSVVLHFTA